MTPPHGLSGAGTAGIGFAERLGRAGERLRPLSPERPEGMTEIRDELLAIQDEAAELGRATLARNLERLALMTEVWECLAAELPESAREAAAFCVRAVEHLAATEGEGG